MDDAFESLRFEMVENQIARRGLRSPRLIEAFRKVPRHSFVPLECQKNAYDDGPIPIGLGQTISQPYIVALMTNLLQLEGNETVLEIGTGSGYQAAILGELAQTVHSIERHLTLADRFIDEVEAWLEQHMPGIIDVETLGIRYAEFLHAHGLAAGLNESTLTIYDGGNPISFAASGLFRYWQKVRNGT